MRMNMRVNYNHNQPETADFPDLFHCFHPRGRRDVRRQEKEREENKENADILVFYYDYFQLIIFMLCTDKEKIFGKLRKYLCFHRSYHVDVVGGDVIL